MKKIGTLLPILISLSAFSQKSDFWQNVRFGGGLALNFGNTTTIGVSPTAVYDFNNGFSLGAGLNYTYTENNNNSANIYGGSLLSLYNISAVDLQLSAEYEHLFVNESFRNQSFNRNVPAGYLGIAYRTNFATLGVRYDVLYDEATSVYSSPITPIVRIFF